MGGRSSGRRTRSSVRCISDPSTGVVCEQLRMRRGGLRRQRSRQSDRDRYQLERQWHGAPSTSRRYAARPGRRSPSRWWNGGTAAHGTWSLHPREEVARSRESPARAQTAALRLAPPATPRARPSLWPTDGMVRAGRSCRRRRFQMRPSRCFLPFRAPPPARAPQSFRRLRPGLGLWRNDGTAARPSCGMEPVGHCNPAPMSRAQC
jgi:hypothetical protein